MVSSRTKYSVSETLTALLGEFNPSRVLSDCQEGSE